MMNFSLKAFLFSLMAFGHGLEVSPVQKATSTQKVPPAAAAKTAASSKNVPPAQKAASSQKVPPAQKVTPVQTETPVKKAHPEQKVATLQIKITPVQKVVQLLQGMLEKGKKDKQAEQVQFSDFAMFCTQELGSREWMIEQETSAIDHLTVDIRKERARAAALALEVAALDRDISNWHGDMDAATKVRRQEKVDYDAMHDDYSDTVDALMRAIATLKKESHDRKQQSGLVQMTQGEKLAALQSMNLIPVSAKRAIDSFLQQGNYGLEGVTASAPEANAYEFQSAGVIDMLEQLLQKFMDERRSIEKQEINGKAAYDTLMKDLEAQIAEAEQRRDEKAVTRSKQLGLKADDKGERNEEAAMRKEDVHYKNDLEATCRVKNSAFKSRQKLRAEEIVAVEKAIEIVSSPELEANAVKHLPTMVQLKKKGTAFSQLRSGSKSWNHVATYLQEQAVKLDSRVLAAIAEHAAVDPFVKVKKMIEDLLVRLVDQANEEAEHKGWCDTELTTNTQTRKDKTNAVETLRAEIDQLRATVSKLKEDIEEATKAVAELDAAMSKETDIRLAEKVKNAETISDARSASNAVEQALAVLREFYVKAGEATALLQRQRRQAPEIFDDAYKGNEGKSEEVLGMLEVIQTDFARLESATKAGEAQSQQEYDQFMLDSKTDKSAKKAEIEHKSAKKIDDSNALANKAADLERTQQELDAALAYFEKLKPSCVDAGDQYDDRVAQRREEIASLREALDKLNGESI